jgi:hemoglobin/transferrin/lactoferrin receptor protein
MKLIAFYLFLFSSFTSVAQIKVVNKYVRGVQGVELYNGSTYLATSLDNGEIKIDTSKIDNATWTLKHQYFYPKKIRKQDLRMSSTILLVEKTNSFEPVLITPGRRATLSNEIASKVHTISAKKISLLQPQTTADLIGIDNKVYIQKSQQGGGSPMMRGFATSRILLVMDDIRMNTAIFREGNVQNVISIDPFTIESTDIIFGPSSQFYGSDAIGGVLSFNSKKPVFAKTDSVIYSGNIDLRYGSASNEKTYHVDFGVGKKRFASFTSLSFSDFGDLRMGSNGPEEYQRPDYVIFTENGDTTLTNNNKNIQVFSGYRQFNFLQKLSFKANEYTSLNYGLHFSNTSDIPRYDRLIVRNSSNELVNGDWYYGPQRWLMHKFHLKSTRNTAFSDSLNVSLAYQNFKESRNDRKVGRIEQRIRTEEVDALSGNIDLQKRLSRKTKLSYGAEYIYNLVGSVGQIRNIENGGLKPTSSRYPDGSTWTSSGVYANVTNRWNIRHRTEGGLRVNRVAIIGEFDSNYNLPNPIFNTDNTAITGSISHLYSLKNGSIGVVASTAFRSPNIDDMGKVFDRNPNTVIVPNTNLKPEYAYNGEINGTYTFWDKLQLEASLFYTYLNQAMSISNSSLNGKDSILYDGTMSQVQTLVNQDYAIISGTQLSARYKLNGNFEARSSYTILENSTSNGDPIRHITPNFGGTSIYLTLNKFNLSFSSAYNQEFTFDKFAPGEKNDAFLYIQDENGNPYSPSWIIFNVNSSYRITEKVKLTLGIDNLLDKRYRPYSSGITAPGRNIHVAFHANI